MGEVAAVINNYRGKRVLVTGHTGFKGTWLSRMLLSFGADVYGIGLDEGPARIFALSQNQNDLISHILDIRDKDAVIKCIKGINPQLVFHLAAQPLVIEGYKSPVKTFTSNIMGTTHVLEACRSLDNLEAAVMITTDKVYFNSGWAYPYRENDPLGGHDPYSASKAACEIVISSYAESFFDNKRICSMRAGNVIGGGDFAENRIIPDLIRAIQSQNELIIRAPHSIRPWQHVLDALWGYVLAGDMLMRKGCTPAPSYNIAPPDNSDSHTVLYVVQKMVETIGSGHYRIDESAGVFKEKTRLRLDPSLIQMDLGWKPAFTTDEAIAQTANEYKAWLEQPGGLKTQLDASITEYLKKTRIAL